LHVSEVKKNVFPDLFPYQKEATMSVQLRLSPLHILYSMVLVLLIGTSPAIAETTTLFGPKTFTKGNGAPVTYNEQFSIPAGASDFQLVVTNGTGEAGEVKNVTIMLNGVEVVSSKDLRSTGNTQKVLSFSLLPVNDLSVTLKGPGGNGVTVQLIGTLLPDLNAPPTDGAPPIPPPPVLPGT
jgi:hypothetical protein